MVMLSTFWNSYIQLYKKFGHLSAHPDGRVKTVGKITRHRRRVVAKRIFNVICSVLGFRLKSVHNLKEKHIRAFMLHSEEKGFSAATMSEFMTSFNLIGTWTGRPHMVKGIEHYVQHPENFMVKSVPDAPKTWSAQDVDVISKINEVMLSNVEMGRVLLVMYIFGMRISEALLLHPHECLRGNVLHICYGAKGGRARSWVLSDQIEYAVIKYLLEVIPPGGTLIPLRYKNKKSFQTRCYQVYKKLGICREDGIVPHGLRHERANLEFELVTGSPSLFIDPNANPLSKEVDKAGREFVANRLGHDINRTSITGAYIGSVPNFKKPQKSKQDVSQKIFILKTNKKEKCMMNKVKDISINNNKNTEVDYDKCSVTDDKFIGELFKNIEKSELFSPVRYSGD